MLLQVPAAGHAVELTGVLGEAADAQGRYLVTAMIGSDLWHVVFAPVLTRHGISCRVQG